MGIFSWRTQDTNESIPVEGSFRETFTVVMTDNFGNKWIEENYQGFGEFGGKDFYGLLAEMNNLPGGSRDLGVELYHNRENKPFLSPNLTIYSEYCDRYWVNEKPEDCEYQGWFYDDCDEDD